MAHIKEQLPQQIDTLRHIGQQYLVQAQKSFEDNVPESIRKYLPEVVAGVGLLMAAAGEEMTKRTDRRTQSVGRVLQLGGLGISALSGLLLLRGQMGEGSSQQADTAQVPISRASAVTPAPAGEEVIHL